MSNKLHNLIIHSYNLLAIVILIISMLIIQNTTYTIGALSISVSLTSLLFYMFNNSRINTEHKQSEISKSRKLIIRSLDNKQKKLSKLCLKTSILESNLSIIYKSFNLNINSIDKTEISHIIQKTNSLFNDINNYKLKTMIFLSYFRSNLSILQDNINYLNNSVTDNETKYTHSKSYKEYKKRINKLITKTYKCFNYKGAIPLIKKLPSKFKIIKYLKNNKKILILIHNNLHKINIYILNGQKDLRYIKNEMIYKIKLNEHKLIK